jgi:hypothetical protein
MLNLKTQTLILKSDNQWKIGPIKEIIEANAGSMEIPGFSNEEH